MAALSRVAASAQTGHRPRPSPRAMLLPKPSRRHRAPTLPAGLDDDALSYLASRLMPAERRALQEIVAGADVLEVEGRRFLLAPVSPRTLDALAAFEAELEDLESSMADDEDCREDVEPSLATPEWPQVGAQYHFTTDDREDDDDRELADYVA